MKTISYFIKREPNKENDLLKKSEKEEKLILIKQNSLEILRTIEINENVNGMVFSEVEWDEILNIKANSHTHNYNKLLISLRKGIPANL